MIQPSRGRARIGVFVPFTNSNLEPDMGLLSPEGVSVHFARIGGYERDEIPDEGQMAALGAADMDEPIEMISGVDPDVVLYGCTSATLAHGPAFDRSLSKRIMEQSGARTVTAAGAVVHAIRTLGARQIGFASPYVASLNDCAISFLESEGITTVGRADVEGDLDNEGQGALTPDDVYALGLQADSPNAEVIVLSCTDMRAIETITRLEETLGKPVVTSNQAMMFQALEALGIPDAPVGFGRLFGRLAS